MTLSVLETSLPMQRSHDTLASSIWAKNWFQNVTGTTGYMAPNWDEPTGATSPQAILFSGNFTIRPLCHERQLHHLATLPTGVTSPCISVEPPCESCQNGRHNEPLPVLPGNELNQSSPKLKTMVVKTINCHHFICLFYQACAISAWHCLFWRLVCQCREVMTP